MIAGKMKTALDLLSNNEGGGVLHISEPSDPSRPDSPSVRDVLKTKHPTGQCIYEDCLLREADHQPSQLFLNLWMPVSLVPLP